MTLLVCAFSVYIPGRIVDGFVRNSVAAGRVGTGRFRRDRLLPLADYGESRCRSCETHFVRLAVSQVFALWAQTLTISRE